MKTIRLQASRSTPRASAIGWLAGLLLVVLAHGVEARPGGSSAPLAASSPGEEVTSLPMQNAATGLTFVGSERELRALILAVDGEGRIAIEQLARRRFAVTLFGDYRVELDRARLASGAVEVSFQGGPVFAGGLGVLQVGSSAPALLDPERVPLHVLARLAQAPRAQGTMLSLRAAGPSGGHAWIQGDLGPERVQLTQVLR